MPAYVIVLRERPVRDADAYAEYQQRNRAEPPVVRLEPLVAMARRRRRKALRPTAWW